MKTVHVESQSGKSRTVWDGTPQGAVIKALPVRAKTLRGAIAALQRIGKRYTEETLFPCPCWTGTTKRRKAATNGAATTAVARTPPALSKSG
jgi:hypothetical protein